MVRRAVVVPERSITQRREALVHANEIRSYRAGLKRDLKARRRSVAEVILHPEPEVQSMKLGDLLLAAPSLGKVKANKVLAHSRLSASKSLGGLTERQRKDVLHSLRVLAESVA